MPYYNFEKDCPIARVTEVEVAGILESLYPDLCVMGFGNTNKYDILTLYKGIQVKFEVKEDFTHAKTGNIGLEFECRGKPSGIAVSEAHFYIYKIHNADKTCGYYLIAKRTLLHMIEQAVYFRIVNDGDEGSNSKCYLFKDCIFYPFAKKLNWSLTK